MAQIRRGPEQIFGGREEAVVLLTYLRFPDLQKHICPQDIDTVIEVVNADQLIEM